MARSTRSIAMLLLLLLPPQAAAPAAAARRVRWWTNFESAGVSAQLKHAQLRMQRMQAGEMGLPPRSQRQRALQSAGLLRRGYADGMSRRAKRSAAVVSEIISEHRRCPLVGIF